jgi:broad specificity phosphatase PhoE
MGFRALKLGRMKRLFLIRHGEPEAAWGESDDPGLSALGRAQAEAAAGALPAGLLLWTSPMRRCRETASPYAERLRRTPVIEARVSEVATPANIADRRAWLSDNFAWRDGAPPRRWLQLDGALRNWRDDVLRAARSAHADCAIFTHFIAINVLVGAAMGREETIVCRPAHASITELDYDGEALSVVRLGASMEAGGEVR